MQLVCCLFNFIKVFSITYSSCHSIYMYLFCFIFSVSPCLFVIQYAVKQVQGKERKRQEMVLVSGCHARLVPPGGRRAPRALAVAAHLLSSPPTEVLFNINYHMQNVFKLHFCFVNELSFRLWTKNFTVNKNILF